LGKQWRVQHTWRQHGCSADERTSVLLITQGPRTVCVLFGLPAKMAAGWRYTLVCVLLLSILPTFDLISSHVEYDLAHAVETAHDRRWGLL